MLNGPRATIAAGRPSYRACFVEGADLFLGEPDFDRIKLCHCGSSRNPSQAPLPAGFRETGRGGPTVSEWIVRGIVGDMGIYQQEWCGADGRASPKRRLGAILRVADYTPAGPDKRYGVRRELCPFHRNWPAP